MVEVAASLVGGRWVVVVLVVAGVGGISLEAGSVGGIWEGVGDVGTFLENVVGASRECPGRERDQPGRGLLDN